MREASCVVVGARYDGDDISGIAVLLAVSRALAAVDLVRNVRFVAFANTAGTSGSEQYVERLSGTGASVHAMLSLDRIDLARDREVSLLVVGNLASRRLVRRTARAFEMASRIAVRGVALPAWVPGVAASDHASFWRCGWPAVMVSDGPLWRVRSADAPDVDSIAAAVPGLIAAVTRLAEA
jgi:Zn-dependent M28 family amino/carboxypeptidase